MIKNSRDTREGKLGYLLIHVWQLCRLGDYLKLKITCANMIVILLQDQVYFKEFMSPRTEALSFCYKFEFLLCTLQNSIMYQQ